MSGLSLKQLRDLMADEIGDDDAQDTANYDRYLNLAATEVWYFAPWPERRDRDFYTMATAEATGTVTLTNDSRAVTGSGTAFSTNGVQRWDKISLGYNKPWYSIREVTDDTNLVLEEKYAGTTAVATTYVIYRDLAFLDEHVETITRVRLHDDSETWDLPVTRGNQTSGAGSYPLSTGRPRWAALDLVIGGQKTLRPGPYAPDKAYRLEYEYLKRYIDMKEDGDVHGLSHRLDDAILRGALAHAYRRDHIQRSQVMEQDFRRRIRGEWARIGEASPMVYQIGMRGGPSDLDQPGDWPVNLDSAEL